MHTLDIELPDIEVSQVCSSEWDLALLNDYPKIQKTIREMMGTVELKHFFDRLIANNKRDGAFRNGFPHDVSKAILSLSVRNHDIIEEKGLIIDNPASDFALTSWELPL